MSDGSAAGPTTLTVLRSLESGPRGLTEEEADARLARHGPNTLPTRRTVPWPGRFIRALHDPFTAVLLCLGLVSAAVAAWGTACVITALVAVSCALRSTGEHRADRAMAALRDLVPTTATVLRRPREGAPPAPRELPVDELAPGDVVRLAPGDLIPADVHLLKSTGLYVNQAALTGESAPVAKHAVDALAGGDSPVDGDPPAGGGTAAPPPSFDSPHLCFQGSSVASGGGTAVVTATGTGTRFAAGYGSTTVRRSRHPHRHPSAFDRSVRGVSWILVRFMLLTPPLVLVADAALRGRGLETLPFAVAVAVGLTPEMLPVVVTTCLARGAADLARTHRVTVKRLPALHDLGAMDVLCVDKTGTLTQDRPVVERTMGEGTEKAETEKADTEKADTETEEALHWAAVNAWWTLQLADLPAPDALDEAILDAADEDALTRYDGIAALPFDPVRRLATAVVTRPGAGLGVHTLVVKGAVENVLERCALPDEERARLQARAAHHAERGLRLLAVATADRPARHRAWTPKDVRGLTFRGFVLLRDALTPAAGPALRTLAGRGVTVKILTGDHPGTAARACHDLGLSLTPDDIRTASDFEDLALPELAELAHRTTVFARCTPELKARVVTALRAHGHTTGFLGDGVNDLPALRAADVGVAPHEATPVARETADVILPEQVPEQVPEPVSEQTPEQTPERTEASGRPCTATDLAALDRAITTGRGGAAQVTAYLCITLSSNLGNVMAMLTAALLLPFLPMLPAQVLAQNLCFDAAQLAFAHERPPSRALRRPTPLRPRPLLRFITRFGALNALADLATFAILAAAAPGPTTTADEPLFHAGWFTENLVTQSVAMLLLRTTRTIGATGTRATPLTWSAGALAAAGLVLPTTPLGQALGMTPLPPLFYVLLCAVVALYATALRALSR
ncbi:HAD family hydrolase [Streptomyces sp. NPDC041068]|uniref:cation-translocating P-type ATPase n=1 Tax=Streptomyces sp. NPDC041068 TaxID=3155130 RepID=UPI0033ED1FB9